MTLPWRASLVACAAAFALCTAVRAQGAAVQISSVAVADGQITISGQNFGSAPSVAIDDQPVGVASSSDTKIVAGLPPLASGFHKLAVSRDGGATAQGTARGSVVIP